MCVYIYICVCLAGITKRNQYRRLFTLTGGRQTIVLRHSSIEIQKPHLGPQGIPETLVREQVSGGNHEAKPSWAWRESRSEINGRGGSFGRTLFPGHVRSKHLGELAGPRAQGVLDPEKR